MGDRIFGNAQSRKGQNDSGVVVGDTLDDALHFGNSIIKDHGRRF